MTTPADDESHVLRGPTDRGALLDFRTVFERLEPLASGELDDFVDPSVLRLHVEDGVGSAEHARLDVVWTTRDDYSVHYSGGDGRNLRWDSHPNDFPAVSGDVHFHPPPDASSNPSDVEPSCIEVTEIELVARAIHLLWRTAYDQESLDGVNDVVNPP